MRIFVINGPNLNLLGTREPAVYGVTTLDGIVAACAAWAEDNGIILATFQSNSEGEIIDAIHTAGREADALVINPGAHTHYSFAIRDALAAVKIPAIEVHISNIHKREAFRRTSVISPATTGMISGLGPYGYILAMQALKHTFGGEA